MDVLFTTACNDLKSTGLPSDVVTLVIMAAIGRSFFLADLSSKPTMSALLLLDVMGSIGIHPFPTTWVSAPPSTMQFDWVICVIFAK